MIALQGQTIPEISRGLIMYLPLDEAQGQQRKDRIGNCIFAENTSYASTAAGKTGNACFTGDADNNFIATINGTTYPHVNSMTHIYDHALDYTWVHWLYNEIEGQDGYHGAPGSGTIYISDNPPAAWGNSYFFMGNVPHADFYYTHAACIGLTRIGWSLIVLRHDSVAKTKSARIYSNGGVHIQSNTYTGAAVGNSSMFRNGLDVMRLGRRSAGTGATNRFKSRWEEFAIWQRHLSDAECDYLFNSGNGRTYYPNGDIL